MDDKYIKDEWFGNHQAKHTDIVEAMEMIEWRHPKSSNYYVLYLRYANYLHISGDVGVATYSAGLNSFKEWADCDFQYFSGKCVSSEYGVQYLEWDRDTIKKDVILKLGKLPRPQGSGL